MIQSLNKAANDVSKEKAAQKVKEKHLYPLRVKNTTIILVPRKKCNKKYAEEYRKTKMGLNY